MGEMLYRSPAYCGALLQRLKQLYDKGQLCDFSLVVGNVEVKIHSAVLFSASTFFKLLMDEGSLKETRFCVQTCNVECLRVLIHFMYTGSLKLSEDNIWITLALASQFDIPEAIDLCQQFLQDVTKKLPTGEPLGDDSGCRVAAVESVAAKIGNDRERLKPDFIDAVSATNDVENILATKVKKEVEEEVDDGDNEAFFPDMLLNYDNDDFADEDYVPSPPTKKHKVKKSKTSAVEDSTRYSVPVEETPTSPHKRRGRPKGSKNKSKTLIDQLQVEVEKTNSEIKPRRKNKHKKKELVLQHVENIETVLSVKDKLHVCLVCNKRFNWISLLLAHQRSHMGGIRYKRLMVNHLVDLAIHNRSYEQSNQLSCTLCAKTFKLVSRCKAHMVKVHRDSSYVYHCRKCSFKPFLHHKNLYLHTFCRHKKHDKKRFYNCTLCKRQFLHLATWLLHNNSAHLGVTVQKKNHKIARKSTQPPLRKLLQSGERKRGRPPGKSNSRTKSHGPRWTCQERGCNYAFVVKNELVQHMSIQHPMVAYSCPEEKCKFSTNIKSQLEKHYEKFHDPSCRNVCDVCGKMFQRSFRLKMHMFSRHKVKDPELTVYSCTVEGCKYSSVLKDGVKKHMRKHEPEKPFICTICGKHFKTEKSVEKHTGKVHLGIRNYVCDICGMAYGDESELKIHIIRHSDTKTFPCEHCDYATFDKGNYKTHLYCKHNIKLEEHMKIFECSMCTFTTSIKYQYSDHMRVHYQVRDIACQQCSKKFITRKSMRSHVMKCHNPKDYHCTVCSYSSADKSKVREHIRIMHTHRHYKPYKCPYCEFQCATGGNCRKHVKHKHKGREVTYIKLDIPEPTPNAASPELEVAHRVGRAQQPILDRAQDYVDINQTGDDYDVKEMGMALHHQPEPQQQQQAKPELAQPLHEAQQQMHQHRILEQHNLQQQQQQQQLQQQLEQQEPHVQMVQSLNMSVVSPYDTSTVSWQTLSAMMQHHHMNM